MSTTTETKDIATQAALEYNPMQDYRPWNLSCMDSYIAKLFKPAPVECPPVLWNPDAGLMIMPYKCIDPDFMPCVKVALSVTPAVVRARYLASYQESADDITKLLLNSGSLGMVHLHGCGSYLSRTKDNVEKLAEQVRRVLLAGARIGQWYKSCEGEGY